MHEYSLVFLVIYIYTVIINSDYICFHFLYFLVQRQHTRNEWLRTLYITLF